MLHVHAHGEVKHFIKSLFATLLGLLMALGLESWHQERHRQHVAEEFFEAVLLETEGNRTALQTLATQNKDVPENLTLVIELLESYQDARAHHQAWRPKDISANISSIHNPGTFKISAWTMALASQSVQRFPKAQAEDLADFYQKLGRFQAFLDQPVDYSTIELLGQCKTFAALKLRLERLSTGELERVVQSLRQLKVHFQMVHQWSEALKEGIEAKQGFRAPSQKH